MARDYSIPVLNGKGATDYARYMRTDDLLSLQRQPEQMVHRDELLFQTVHQSTELWLKHACFEVESATAHIRSKDIDGAAALLARASLGVKLITGQLEMLSHITPADFQTVRTVLGNGSGFESPGWNAVRQVSMDIGDAFTEHCARQGADLIDLYRGSQHQPLYRLAEALVEWDERITLWRIRHFRVAVRTIGIQAVGTKGTPVDQLYQLITRKYFPALWQVRSDLTLAGPLGGLVPAQDEEVG